MPNDRSFASPILQTITIRLNDKASQQDAEARQEIALNALAEILIALNEGLPPAWTVRAVPDGQPSLYELTPLSDHIVLAREAWEMIYALRGQPEIAAAEPTFVYGKERR